MIVENLPYVTKIFNKKNFIRHSLSKLQKCNTKTKILKAVRENEQFSYKSKFIRITSDLSTKA